MDTLTLNSQVPAHFELQGEERLGSALIIVPFQSVSLELGKCKFQWQRVHGLKAEPIIGKQIRSLMLTLNFSVHMQFSGGRYG